MQYVSVRVFLVSLVPSDYHIYCGDHRTLFDGMFESLAKTFGAVVEVVLAPTPETMLLPGLESGLNLTSNKMPVRMHVQGCHAPYYVAEQHGVKYFGGVIALSTVQILYTNPNDVGARATDRILNLVQHCDSISVILQPCYYTPVPQPAIVLTTQLPAQSSVQSSVQSSADESCLDQVTQAANILKQLSKQTTTPSLTRLRTRSVVPGAPRKKHSRRCSPREHVPRRLNFD